MMAASAVAVFLMAVSPFPYGASVAATETVLAWFELLPTAWFTPTMPVLPLIELKICPVLWALTSFTPLPEFS
jgi:hypothetical protein